MVARFANARGMEESAKQTDGAATEKPARPDFGMYFGTR